MYSKKYETKIDKYVDEFLEILLNFNGTYT